MSEPGYPRDFSLGEVHRIVGAHPLAATSAHREAPRERQGRGHPAGSPRVAPAHPEDPSSVALDGREGMFFARLVLAGRDSGVIVEVVDATSGRVVRRVSPDEVDELTRTVEAYEAVRRRHALGRSAGPVSGGDTR